MATQLARDLGFSMTPVREALMQLANDGLLEIAPHRGVRVADIADDDLVDTYVVRAIVESAAARLAAARIRPEEIAQLRRVHRQFVDAASARDPDVARLRELNEEFHFIIYAAAGSPLLRRMIRTAWTSSPRDTFGVLPLKTARDDHGALIEALETRDGDRAEDVMREHIEESAKLLRLFKKSKRKH